MAKKQKSLTVADWAGLYLQHVDHVYRRGFHFVFNGLHYRKIEDQIMLRAISRLISKTDPSLASSILVENVVATIAILTAIPSEPPEPLRLDGQPVENVIVFENGTLNLDRFIEEQCREPKLLSVSP